MRFLHKLFAIAYLNGAIGTGLMIEKAYPCDEDDTLCTYRTVAAASVWPLVMNYVVLEAIT